MVGFTGTRWGMNPHQMRKLEMMLAYMDICELHHGDCKGADYQAHLLAKKYSIRTIVHPPVDRIFRAFCDGDIVLPPKSYLQRNRDIVDSVELLIAAPIYRIWYRSGTWYTIDYARKKGIDVVIL